MPTKNRQIKIKNTNTNKGVFRNYSEIALALGLSASTLTTPQLVITHSAPQAEKIIGLLASINSNITPFYFPDWETLAYDKYSPSPNIIANRLQFLYKVRDSTTSIIVTSIDAILSKLCPMSYLDSHGLIVNVGDIITNKDLSHRLMQAGFQRVSQVSERGEYSQRGSILDVFPPGSKLAIRIDFFDDTVEQLRVFDVKTQLSSAKIEHVEIIPSREVDLSDTGRVCFRQNMRNWLGKEAEFHSIYKKISEGGISGGLEYYLPLFFDETMDIFDYLPKNTSIFIEHGYKNYTKQFLANAQNRYNRVNNLSNTKPLTVENLYLTATEFYSKLDLRLDNQNPDIHRFKAYKFTGNSNERLTQLQTLTHKKSNFYLFCQSDGQRELLQSKLNIEVTQQQFIDWTFCGKSMGVGYFPYSLQIKFDDAEVYLISANEVLSQVTHETTEQQLDPMAIIDDLAQIQLGDPVVHHEHGVGRYQGLERMTIDDEVSEYISISYAKEEKLYIPVTSLEAITRYTGASAENAPLHSLDGSQWEKAKSKAKEKIYDTATELLEIYAKREAATSEAVIIPYDELKEFSKGFIFNPTKDQESTFNQVYKGLESKRPMDRIVCGDVGFGKTEVAMRAAFAVAASGKQVAILVPTTLLAEQHYKNFIDRFSAFAINIAALSRFKSSKEQKQMLAEVESGNIDIIIGTHRLIQKDVKFHNLGLLIIDEEHKFGVKQKETMKEMRADVNILTLTATPIPRTLSMSMSGLRELSIIASPPPKRTPIHTILTQYDEAIIHEGIERELTRGGQIYFLHNNIATMEHVQNSLQQLYPNLNIKHANGQMREKELEKIMLDFHNQHFDLLLTTTIIESGIDNPNANTIFINRADKFGLAQLHQLRGRVGRSHHQAYAYLITPSDNIMTNDAQKRMTALSSLTGLGVGFMLASQDLEIRGAGELLGDNQSGQITEIGFSLFNEMLEQTIDAIKHNKKIDFTNNSNEIDIELGSPALIPEDYIYDVHSRLIFYKRIASCKSDSELDQLQIELIDRFGLLAQPIKTLFMLTEIKLLARQLGISKLIADEEKITVTLGDDHHIDGDKLISLIQQSPMKYQLKAKDKFVILEATTTIETRTNFIKLWLQGFVTD